MRHINNMFISTLIILFIFISCSNESSTNPVEDLIKAQIDLQSGFGGNHVVVEYNGEYIFNAQLSEGEPFAGPLATFTTNFPKGKNKIYIHWGLNYSFQSESIDFIVADNEVVYIGIRLSGDTIDFNIQNNEFLYAFDIFRNNCIKCILTSASTRTA